VLVNNAGGIFATREAIVDGIEMALGTPWTGQSACRR